MVREVPVEESSGSQDCQAKVLRSLHTERFVKKCHKIQIVPVISELAVLRIQAMNTKICLEKRHFGKKHEVDIKPDVAK